MEKQSGITKIVWRSGVASLYHRNFDDIQAESWGVVSLRPLVYISDAHDAIEKSMWCYLNGMVPLAGEKDPDLTARLAAAYEIDSIIADISSLKLLFSRFVPPHGQLIAISLLGDSFDESEYASYRQYANRFRLVQTDSNGISITVCDL